MRQHLAFLLYLWRHKRRVWQVGRRLGVGRWRLFWHDMDKLLPDEYPYYKRAWATRQPVEPLARQRHIRRCKHHWQSWVLLQDDGSPIALPIPEPHWKEMLADWEGAAWVTGARGSSAWYMAHRDKIILHPETRRKIERAWEMLKRSY